MADRLHLQVWLYGHKAKLTQRKPLQAMQPARENERKQGIGNARLVSMKKQRRTKALPGHDADGRAASGAL